MLSAPTPNSALAEALAQLPKDGPAEAVAAMERLLPTLEAPQDRAWALLTMATSLPRLGRHPAAVRAGSEAVLLFEDLDDPHNLCDARNALALAYAQLDLGREAIEQALGALELARQLNDHEREAWSLVRLGNAYMALGDPIQARETTQQAREVAQRHGLHDLDFACLSNQAYYTLHECEELARDGDIENMPIVQALAQTLAQDALSAAQRDRDAYREALALTNLIDALLLGGDGARIDPLLTDLEHITLTRGYASLALDAKLQRAMLLCLQDHVDEAITHAEQLLHDPDPAKMRRMERRTLQLLYDTHKTLGNAPVALYYLERLLDAERRAVRQAQAVQTQVLLIRQEVHQAITRAAYASADARELRHRAAALEEEQALLRERLNATEHAAYEDVLTRLANRRHAESALPLLHARACEQQQALMVGILDIDHFKRVNDSFGHGVGDRVLREFANLMRQQLRGADVLARWGGEEFLVALVGDSARNAAVILERLRAAVTLHDWAALQPGLKITASAGFALHRGPTPPPSWQALLQRADQALYRAKASGRNRVSSA